MLLADEARSQPERRVLVPSARGRRVARRRAPNAKVTDIDGVPQSTSTIFSPDLTVLEVSTDARRDDEAGVIDTSRTTSDGRDGGRSDRADRDRVERGQPVEADLRQVPARRTEPSERPDADSTPDQ